MTRERPKPLRRLDDLRRPDDDLVSKGLFAGLDPVREDACC